MLGGPGGLPQDVFRRVRVDAGVAASTPVVEGYAVALDLERQPLHVLGLDPFSDAPFRAHLAQSRRARRPASRASSWTSARPSSRPRSRRATASHLGSPLRLSVQDRIETLEVAGIAHPAAKDEAAALETVVLVDVSAAQRLFRLGDRITRVDLIADEAGLARVARVLPPGARVVPASEQAQAIGQLTDAFPLNLTALSLLALVVGMFLIYNTVTFSVVQRRAVIGTLRLLGATPRQVASLVLLETAAASAVGAALGLGLGWVLGQGAVRLVTRTINDLYYVVSVSSAPLTWLSVAKAAVLGLGAGVLSAIPPALEAARVEPVEALRRSSFDGAGRPPGAAGRRRRPRSSPAPARCCSPRPAGRSSRASPASSRWSSASRSWPPSPRSA